jgi:hypothetical protein
MGKALTGRATVRQQYDHALEQIRARLHSTPDEQVLASSDEALAEQLVDDWIIEPIEEDQSRPIQSTQRREFQPGRDVFDRSVKREVTFADLEIPLVPRSSNAIAVNLSSGDGWPIWTGYRGNLLIQ